MVHESYWKIMIWLSDFTLLQIPPKIKYSDGGGIEKNSEFIQITLFETSIILHARTYLWVESILPILFFVPVPDSTPFILC